MCDWQVSLQDQLTARPAAASERALGSRRRKPVEAGGSGIHTAAASGPALMPGDSTRSVVFCSLTAGRRRPNIAYHMDSHVETFLRNGCESETLDRGKVPRLRDSKLSPPLEIDRMHDAGPADG